MNIQLLNNGILHVLVSHLFLNFLSQMLNCSMIDFCRLYSSYGRLSSYHWCRVWHKDNWSFWTKDQASNMGYSRARKIQVCLTSTMYQIPFPQLCPFNRTMLLFSMDRKTQHLSSVYLDDNKNMPEENHFW